MIRLLDRTRILWFNYFYVFCIIIYAGRATVFARDLGDIRTLGNAFGLIITAIFIIINRIQFNRRYAISLLVFLSYAAATSINNHLINPFWISQWIIWLTIAYCICQGFGSKLFVTFETVLYHLSIIALFIWILHILFPSVVEFIVKTFEFSRPYAEDDNVAANMIFYTLGTDQGETYVDAFYRVRRNPGFVWEPGAYASFLCLGIFCNVIRNQIRLRQNKALWIFLIALFSTQSTTGFMTLMLMMGVWMLANRKFGWALALIPLAVALLSLPFVGDKLLSEVENIQIESAMFSRGALDRTTSLIIDFQEFKRHPILGIGGWTEGTWYAQNGYEFATISGIGGLLSQYGAIITVLFFVLLFKSAKYIGLLTESNSAYMMIAAIIGMMYSYGLWSTPLYISFWMFCCYGVDSKKSKLVCCRP